MISVYQIFIAAIPLVCAYHIIASVVAWYRLREFPGPLLAAISYFPMLRRSRSGRAHIEYHDITKRYGSIVRIGPNDLLTSNPELIRRMSAARSTYARSTWYRAMRLDPYHDTMGSVRDVDIHDALKTKTAAGYAGKENPALESGIDSQVKALVNLLKKKYLSSSEKFGQLILARLASTLRLTPSHLWRLVNHLDFSLKMETSTSISRRPRTWST